MPKDPPNTVPQVSGDKGKVAGKQKSLDSVCYYCVKSGCLQSQVTEKSFYSCGHI